MKNRQPQLTTKRLKLIPLMPEQMLQLIKDPNALCSSLGLIPDDAPKSTADAEFAENQYQKMMADSEYMAFHTLWLITQIEEKHMIGYLYFTAAPSDTGMVELDGTIKSSYRRKGYMTEAAAILRAWAFSKKGVIMMLAHPQKEDEAFHGLLRKLGFAHWIEREDSADTEVWCCEKPVRATIRIGVLLGIGGGAAFGLITKLGLLLCGIVGFVLGVALCAYLDARARKARYTTLTAELAKKNSAIRD